jgi:fluoride exporter
MSYFWVALGGAIGSVLRFALSGVFARWLGHAFLGTTVVNITGSFVIGVIAALGPLALWEQLLMIGVCGGYTTFSSFSLQTLELIQQGRWTVAFSNAVASVVFCVIAVWLGHACGSLLKR